MFGGYTYVIRPATPEDETVLRRLAALDSQAPLAAPALIGEIAGRPAAALSLADGRAIADPFEATSHLVVQLRLRASALLAYERTPSLAARVRAALQSAPAAAPART